MKRVSTILIACLVLLGSIVTTAFADEYVHGYTRRNGTYVAPYHRSSPDHSYNNNWSVSPNVNPYTGKQGTHSPTFDDRSPTYNRQNFGAPGYVQPPQQQPFGLGH